MSRVIYSWNYAEWGGAQIHFLALLREARKEFETVVVLPDSTDHQFLGFLQAEGIRFETFDGSIDLGQKHGSIEKLQRHWTRFRAESSMLKKIREVGIENTIVHTDITPSQSLLSLAYLCLRAPVFITLHNAMPPVSKWRWILWKIKYRLISMFANFNVFVTNRHAGKYFEQLFGDRVNRNTKITYDSIDPAAVKGALAETFDRGATLKRLGISEGKFVVLTVGQFVDRKGRWVLLEAAKTIASQNDKISFVWVAPSLAEGLDRKRVDEFELGEGFKLVRSSDVGTARPDILRFFQVADVFALPSYVEGVPIALLEAMAIGLPCISTRVYGIPEAIVHNETGLLIEPGDADQLAASILSLYGDHELRRRLSSNGRAHVIKNFDQRQAARIAVAAYKEAIPLRND